MSEPKKMGFVLSDFLAKILPPGTLEAESADGVWRIGRFVLSESAKYEKAVKDKRKEVAVALRAFAKQDAQAGNLERVTKLKTEIDRLDPPVSVPVPEAEIPFFLGVTMENTEMGERDTIVFASDGTATRVYMGKPVPLTWKYDGIGTDKILAKVYDQEWRIVVDSRKKMLNASYDKDKKSWSYKVK